MSKISQAISTIIALAIIGGIGFLIYKLIQLFFANSDKVDSSIVVAIIAGSITILGYFITRYLERKQKIEQQIREQKIPIYEEFLKFFFEMLSREKTNKMSAEDMQQFIAKFNERAIIWLSDDSLKAYIEWRDQTTKTSNDKDNNLTSLVEFEKLLLSFRRDIGHKNLNLKRGDLLSMFINDLDQYLKR